MTHSESLINISKALLKAQKSIGAASKGSINPFFKSKYADLGSVMEACKPALNENDIVVLQPVGSDDQGVYVETFLLHISGEYMADRMRISAKSQNDPQAQGSAITYARRYSLQSIMFIPSEDDDAEKATHTSSGQNKTTNPQSSAVSDQEHFCKIHNKPMKERVAQNGGHYYDHRWLDDAQEWQKCPGIEKKKKDEFSDYDWDGAPDMV